MKCAVSTLLVLLLGLRIHASVLTFSLNELEVRTIPVSCAKVTTIQFPGPIHALTAVNVTSQATNVGGFQLDFHPGSAFLALRALQPRASANVNVLWNGKTYVFEIIESDAPALSVVMQSPPSLAELSRRQGALNPTRLIGVLQKAKAYGLLVRSHPQSVWGVSRAEPLTLVEYPDWDVRLEEVFRFDPEDTLVFRVWIANKTDHRVDYKGLAVRVGERVYLHSVMDAKGSLDPKEEQIVYFAVTGSPGGSRNNLSLKNDFKILLR